MKNGTLLIVGGGIGVSREIIFSRFIDCAGGVSSKVGVIVAASNEPIESFESVKETLVSLGLAKENIKLIPITRNEDYIKNGWKDYGESSLVSELENVSGVWFTGGDQLNITKALLNEDMSDSPVLIRIRNILENGGVVGGTSAGAAIMSEDMIARGDDAGALNFPVVRDVASYLEEDSNEFLEKMLITKGLGFFKKGIIDQHFNKRARLQRLICALETCNQNNGFGISEDTAMVIPFKTAEKIQFEVLGSGYVVWVRLNEDKSVCIKKIFKN